MPPRILRPFSGRPALPGTGTSATPATGVLAASTAATYTDGNNQPWTEYFDSLGFGERSKPSIPWATPP